MTNDDKRFEAACAAMQSLIILEGIDLTHGITSKKAVEAADALLAALSPPAEQGEPIGASSRKIEGRSERGSWLDSLGRLYDWLGELLREHPNLRDCGLFTLDGSGLDENHFQWCNSDGEHVELDRATDVSIATLDVDEAPEVRRLTAEVSRLKAENDDLQEQVARLHQVLSPVRRYIATGVVKDSINYVGFTVAQLNEVSAALTPAERSE